MQHISFLGHELIVGSNVEFWSCGHKIIGHIIDFVGDKAVIKPLGWRGEPEFKDKIRRQYKVISHNCWVVNIKYKE